MTKKNQNTRRSVPERDRVILWARAAGRCCFPNCRLELIEPATSVNKDAIYGQAAHVVAHSSIGPRNDASFPQEQLDKYENLALLCGNHHTIVDKQPNTYTVDDLRSWKSEHESWVKQKTSPDKYEPLKWQVIIQEDSPQINEGDVLRVLHPDVHDQVLHLNEKFENENWIQIAKSQEEKVQNLLNSVQPKDRRFVVYSLTRIPLAMHLGFILNDKCRVVPFQFHRTNGKWEWPDNTNWEPDFNAIDCRELKTIGNGPVVFRISLSAKVTEDHFRQILPSAIGDVSLSVSEPSVEWLRSRDQVEALTVKYRECFQLIAQRFGPRCNGIHVFFAGPTGGAINLGRSINLRMSPSVTTYEYNSNSTPTYRPALTFGE